MFKKQTKLIDKTVFTRDSWERLQTIVIKNRVLKVAKTVTLSRKPIHS